MKILIVEDEIIISDDIQMMLEENGYDVVEQATDYDEAIYAIDHDRPDLILLDISLKGEKTGIDIGHYINKKNPVPFIYTSALVDEKTIEGAKKTKPASYLVKPFKKEQLVTAIEIAMASFSKPAERKKEDESITIFNDSIFVKHGDRFVKVDIPKILYVQKSDNYLDIYLEDNRYTIRATIGGFIEQLNYDRLFRTHKSYAVNLDYIHNFSPIKVLVGKYEVPISKQYADKLKSQLNIF
ncbi:MAG: response regulator [Saprospiraceae bacterium]|nr:response regulator [Saprospiraceae bacterium]